KESLTETHYHVISHVQSRLITITAHPQIPPRTTREAAQDHQDGHPHWTTREILICAQAAANQCPGSCQSVPTHNAYHCQCHQGCLSVPHISAVYQCLSVPRISAHQCPAVLSISAQQCRLSVPPISATHKNPSLQPFSAHQCHPVSPMSAHQCRLSMPIS
ncbi:hypothetical protein AB205_0062310, partial [Aquarana catesbeiana]